MFSVVFKGQKVTFCTKYHLLTLLKNTFVFPFHSKYFIYVDEFKQQFHIFRDGTIQSVNVQNIFFGILNTYDHFHVATLYESANIAKNKSSYFTPELRSKLWCGGRTG